MVDVLAVSQGGLPDLPSSPSTTRGTFKMLANLIIVPLYFIIIIVAIILSLKLAFLPDKYFLFCGDQSVD